MKVGDLVLDVEHMRVGRLFAVEFSYVRAWFPTGYCWPFHKSRAIEVGSFVDSWKFLSLSEETQNTILQDIEYWRKGS